MNHDRKIIPDAEVFLTPDRITLADVLARAEAELEGTQKRDTRSAFKVLETNMGYRLEDVPAVAERVRDLLRGLTPGATGLGEKRLANVRSAVVRAVDRFGPGRVAITRRIPLDSAWRALLDGIDRAEWRGGLGRLACYARDISDDS